MARHPARCLPAVLLATLPHAAALPAGDEAGGGPPADQRPAWQASLPGSSGAPTEPSPTPPGPAAGGPLPVFITEEGSRDRRRDPGTRNGEVTVVVGAEVAQCEGGRLVVPAVEVGGVRLPAGDPCPGTPAPAGGADAAGEPAAGDAARCDAEGWRCRTGPD